MTRSTNMFIVIQSSEQISSPVYGWGIGEPFCSIHEYVVLEVLQLSCMSTKQLEKLKEYRQIILAIWLVINDNKNFFFCLPLICLMKREQLIKVAKIQ